MRHSILGDKIPRILEMIQENHDKNQIAIKHIIESSQNLASVELIQSRFDEVPSQIKRALDDASNTLFVTKQKYSELSLKVDSSNKQVLCNNADLQTFGERLKLLD